MSSLLVRGRSSTLGNRSASESDLSSKFRHRSVQSINHFSLRRKLGTEPTIHSLQSMSNDAVNPNPTRQAEPPSLPHPQTGGWLRTNRGDVLVPQPFSSCRRSHLDPHNLPAPAIVIFHPPDASDMSASPSSPPSTPTPQPQPQLHEHHHHHYHDQNLASTNPVGNPADSIPLLRLPLASILKPFLTTLPLQLPQNQTMGNRLTNRLHPGRYMYKENESPTEIKPESAKLIVRPASSPAPTRLIHPPGLPFPVFIPDRRSSIVPQPYRAPGNGSSARTGRSGLGDNIIVHHPPPLPPPRRSATAPGTKPVGETHLSPPPIHANEISSSSSSTSQTPTTKTTKPPPSTSPSKPPNTTNTTTTTTTSTFPFPFPLLPLPLPIRPPPLTLAHFACYTSHRRMTFSPNAHNPLPCMTCETESGNARWKCQWCCLRICPGCMERLSRVERRGLRGLVEGLEGEGIGRGGEWGLGVGGIWREGDGKENRKWNRDGGRDAGVGDERGLGVGGMDGRKAQRRAAHGYRQSHAHGYRQSHGHGHRHGHRQSHRQRHSHSHGHGNGYGYGYGNRYGYGYGYGNGSGNGSGRLLYDGHGHGNGWSVGVLR